MALLLIFKKEYKLFYVSMSFRPCRIIDRCLNKPVYEGWNFNSGNYLFTTDIK